MDFQLQMDWPTSRTQWRGIKNRLANFRPMATALGRQMEHWASRNFSTEGAMLDEFPSGWPKLSAATLERKRRQGQGTRILHGTGRLAQGTVVLPQADGIVMDNPVPYAARHHLGQGVPRRPVLPSPAQAQRIALPAVKSHVQEALS